MAREMSRRKFLVSASVGLAGMMLASCAPQPAPTAVEPVGTPQPTPVEQVGTPQPVPTQPQRVTFTMYGHPGMIEEMVPLFNETHPDVEVVFERSEGAGYWEKLSAAVAAGTAWDCFRIETLQAVTWGPAGTLADIRPFLDADTTYPADLYLPGILDTYTVEGSIYGLPTWCLTMWLYYNKKMFDEAGIEYPTPETTWEQYVEMGKALTKRDAEGRVIQYGTNGWDWWTMPVAQVVWSNGGCFFYNEDLTRVCVDDPKTVEALQDIADLILVHKTNPNPAVPSPAPVGLLSDNVATEANGDWLPWDNREVFMEKYDYLDATLCPTRKGKRVNIYWPDGFGINSASKVKEGAYKWMSWFAASPEATAIQCKVVFPVTMRAYEDRSIAEKWLQPPRPRGMIDLAMEHKKDARFWRVEGHIPDINNAYYGEISRLWTGEATAEEVARTIAELANKAMQTPIQ